jgi:hypothetical protein
VKAPDDPVFPGRDGGYLPRSKAPLSVIEQRHLARAADVQLAASAAHSDVEIA